MPFIRMVTKENDKKRRWYQCRSSEESTGQEPDEKETKDEGQKAVDAAQQPDHSASPQLQSDHSSAQQTTAFTIEIPDDSASVLNNSPPAVVKAAKPAPVKENLVRKKRETLEAKRERKAAKTLAIITGAFVVCWLPFFVCALLMPLKPDWVFDETMLSVFLWLGYFNSTLNPIIYTIFSPEFRQAFKRLLCGKAAVNGTSAYRPRKLR